MITMHESIDECYEASTFQSTGRTVKVPQQDERHEVQECSVCERECAEVYDQRTGEFITVRRRE